MPPLEPWYIQSEFASQFDAIVDTLVKRLLPNFEEISKEADKASEDAWDEYMSRPPATEYDDPADYAEQAENVGISLYSLLSGVCQGMISLFAVALYHALEQQIMRLHKLEPTHWCYHIGQQQSPVETFRKEKQCQGIDISKFKSWGKIDELRLVANTVKHAEGKSAEKLRGIRPSIFEFPDAPITQPLLGEDISVSVQDIESYRDNLIQFWEEFSASQPGGECDPVLGEWS